MTYLLDTNVISALAPSRSDRPQVLVDWLDRKSDELFLSVVTATEVHDGIAKAGRAGATRKASTLTAWWDQVEARFADRLLSFDLKAATLAGRLSDRARAAGLSPGFADIAIAATAGAHGHALLTRNLKDFRALGIIASDPFATPPKS